MWRRHRRVGMAQRATPLKFRLQAAMGERALQHAPQPKGCTPTLTVGGAHPTCRARPTRWAFTMVELLMAMTVMVIISGAVASLASAVYTNNDYSQGVAIATQHGRVTLERIGQTVRSATSSETFPGCAVVDLVSGCHITETLVVWHPNGAPANAAGPPLANELVI